MIRKIRIRGYKSLKNVEINLGELTVLIGPNASGKSNLFDILKLLSQAVGSGDLDEAFDHHRGSRLEAFSLGEGGIEVMKDQGRASLEIEAEVRLSPQIVKEVDRELLDLIEQDKAKASVGLHSPLGVSRTYRYRIIVGIKTESGALRILEEELVWLDSGAERQCEKQILHRSEERMRISHGVRAGGAVRVSAQQISVSCRSLEGAYVIDMLAFTKELSRWRFHQLEPRAMKADASLKSTERLQENGADLAAFYNTLQVEDPRQFRFLKRSINTLLPSLEGIEVKQDSQGMLQLSVIENGIPYSIRVASEGTLRILAMLAIFSPKALESTTTLGYEEPENGVHPRRLKLVANILQNAAQRRDGVQVLVTSHSPALPEFFEPASLIMCRKKGQESVFEQPFQAIQEVNAGDMPEVVDSFTARVMRGDFDG